MSGLGTHDGGTHDGGTHDGAHDDGAHDDGAHDGGARGERSAPDGDAEPGRPAAVVIAAKDEEVRITATVRAARALAGVDLVVVVDDGSTDGTSYAAQREGALVLRHSRNRGKAAAMAAGAAAVDAADAREQRDPRLLVFLDADLGDTAAAAGPLLGPVRRGEVDMTIAVLPTQRTPGGGRGFVVNLARRGIERATGFTAAAPLSGQRCLTRAAFEAACPLAHGFGVETGLTIDLLRAGYTVREVDCALHHRVTGTDWRAQLHRFRQYRHVGRALAARRLPAWSRAANRWPRSRRRRA